MKLILNNRDSEIFIPDNIAPEKALKRTTHLGIGAHPDDLEILAYPGIEECFKDCKKWFSGVTVTGGGGSPRTGKYKNFSGEEIAALRRKESKKAAQKGGYGALCLLNYESQALFSGQNRKLVEDLKYLIKMSGPAVIYTHNPFDKHPTHAAVCLSVIKALREISGRMKLPLKAFYGCEVWRSLDWLPEKDRVALPVGKNKKLQKKLLSVFDSQISGGKRYDKAAPGRSRANATFNEPDRVDAFPGVIFAVSLMPLIEKNAPGMKEFAKTHISRFFADIMRKLSYEK